MPSSVSFDVYSISEIGGVETLTSDLNQERYIPAEAILKPINQDFWLRVDVEGLTSSIHPGLIVTYIE